ncbi:MAG: hypothetical protein U0894_02120 [Pirellulales bacterium]
MKEQILVIAQIARDDDIENQWNNRTGLVGIAESAGLAALLDFPQQKVSQANVGWLGNIGVLVEPSEDCIESR